MKRKLFLLLSLMLGFVLGIKAGTNVTASYIGDVTWIVNGGGWHGSCGNNHKESNGIGWWNNQTISGAHAFANPSGSDPGESWSPNFGTAGVMMGRTMVLPAGNYTLSFDAFGCNATNSAEPSAIPSAGDAVAFLTGEANVDITNLTPGEATFHNVSFTFDVTTDNTAFEFGIKKLTNDSKIDWCQIKNVSLQLNSTNIFPVANNTTSDFTYSLAEAAEKDTWHTNTWSTEGQSDGSRFQVPFHELWKNSGGKLFDATITASHTPAESGVYKVSAWVRVANESGGAINGVNIFVGDTKTNACTGTSIMGGKGRLGTYTAMADGVAGTPFDYGFEIQNSDANWLSFKNVVITYLGDLPQAEIDALLTQVPTGKMSASVQAELNSKVNDLNTDKSVAAYNALASYIATANASVIVYENIATLITTYQTKANALDDAGQSAYTAALAVADGFNDKYEAGTYETESEAEADLQAALAVAAKAQTTNGADMTAVIANPSFETGTYDGWTVNSGAGLVVRNQGELSNMVGNYYALVQRNGSDRFVSQTINSLHQGKYVLSVNAMANTDAGNVTLNLGTFSTSIPSNATAATYTVAYETAESANAEIKIAATGGEGTLRRCFFDYFTLTYYTELPDVDITELAAKPMKASVLSALNNASTTYADSKTVTNYNSLQNAIVEAKISAEIYSAYAVYEAKAQANLTEAGITAFNSNETVAPYNNGTYDGTETNEAAIRTAYVNALKVYYTVGSDMTDLITNPSFETGNFDGWTNDGMGAQDNKAFDRTDGDYYVESWHPGTAGVKSVIATVAELPAGFYKLTVAAYADDVNSAKIFAKNGDTEYNTSVSTSRDYTVGLYYDGTSTFTIGYSADMKKGAGWVCVDNFRLNYYGANDATCLIKDADCSSNDFWPGSGRTFDTKTDWTGTSRQVFSNNGKSYNRSQAVTFPLAGKYRLDVYGLIENETGYFMAKVDETEKSQNYNQSLNHYIVANDGTEGNTVKTSGSGWTIQEVYFDIANANDVATIALRPSEGNGSGHTEYGYIGGLKLTYLGTSGTLVDMQVSATAKIGTFCAPYDTKVPARVTAHTVSQGSGDWIRLSDPLEDGIIPAGTPVILQAEDGIAVAIQKTYFGTDNTAASDSYVLKGLYVAESKVSEVNPYYILQYVAEDGGAGFYRVPTGQTRNLAANRCYLLPDNVNSGARIAIGGEDDPTAINEVEVIESEAKTMKDGKYFVKGRIVIVKNGKAFSTNGQKLN